MQVTVTNTGMDYHAKSSSGREQSIVSGPGKPASDKTMSPLELFVASLGMCVAAMLRSYCEHRELACGEIRVEVQGKWESGDPLCEDLRVRVEVEGDWDERRKAAFLRVAESCPVHRTICNCSGTHIEIV